MTFKRPLGTALAPLLAAVACSTGSGSNDPSEPLDSTAANSAPTTSMTSEGGEPPSSSLEPSAPSTPGGGNGGDSSNPPPPSDGTSSGGTPSSEPEAASGNGGGSNPGGASGNASTGGQSQAGAAPDESGGASAGGTQGDGDAGMSSGGNPAAAGAGGNSDGAVTVDGTRFTIASELASDVDPAAPTTVGIVSWSTDLGEISEAFVEFGLETDYGTRAPVDLAEADYRTLLLGMKPERTYHFRVLATSSGVTYASDDMTIETGAPTTLIDIQFDVENAASQERGFILTSYWQGPDGAVPFIIDADGEIVWWYDSSSNGIARARMSADGKNMWLVLASNQGGPLERVTMDTLDGEVYTDIVASHDITPVSGDVMAFLEYGESDCDSIFEVDPSGEAREIFETEGLVEGMCHANAVRYSAAEDLYSYSDVSTDVFVIDRQGQLQWRLSERLAEGNDAWGGTQHGHHLLANSMLIFANRFSGSDTSAAVEYSFDGEELMRYESGNFSANLGDAQRLPGGNTLVTFSNDSIIHEVDADGNLVLEINGGGDALGYAAWHETLYGPPPDIID